MQVPHEVRATEGIKWEVIKLPLQKEDGQSSLDVLLSITPVPEDKGITENTGVPK